MNTLHIFGCSYSEPFSSNTYDEYVNYLNYTPKSWSELLSESLDFKLNNTSEGGSSNEEIFEKFCINMDSYKKGDIIIIQWSFLHRFRLAAEDGNGWERFGICNNADNWPVDFINGFALNKTKDVWKKQLYNFHKIIDKICHEVGCKVYYWYVGNEFIYDQENLKNMNQYLLNDVGINPLLYIQDNLGEVPIEVETNGSVKDQHFGISAHKTISKLFLNQIKK